MAPMREKAPTNSHSGASQPHHAEKKFNKTPSDAVSYEDLLVAQYLEGLKRAETSKKKLNRPSSKPSPYLKKMEHSDFVSSRSSTVTLPKGSRRPASAAVMGRNAGREKKRIDAKYIADAGKFLVLLEEHEAEEEDKKRKKKSRPSSAPVYQTKRPLSAKSATSTSTSIRSYRSKHQYRQQPFVIRAIAYKNGTQKDGVKITCPTMKIFLETCTIKLGLKFAARRVFLSDGREVRNAAEIPKDGEVYISEGEPFRDPLGPVQGTAHKKLHAAWTVNGIVLPHEARKKTKPALSKRMRKMLASNTRRIMFFQNGDGTEVCETVATLDRFDKFLDDCTMKLGLNSAAKIVYTWDKQQITQISDIEMLDQCLQSSTTPLYGPVWISQGENFRASGVADFLTTTIKHCKQKLREAKQYKTQLNLALNGDTDKVTMVAILSKSKEEQQKDLEETEEGIYEFTDVKERLQALLEDIAEDASAEKESGSSYTMKHIKELDLSHRLVGQKGLRLKVYENGTNEGEAIVFFNLKDASKGVSDDKTLILQRLLDVISGSVQLEKNTTALSTVVTKIFDKNGTEITDVYSLKYDQEIWISFGEEFKDPNVYCMQLSLDTVSGSSYFGEHNVAVRKALTSDNGPNVEQHTQWDASIGFPVLYDFNKLGETSMIDELDRFLDELKSSRLDVNGHFLQHKDDPSVVLYPEVTVGLKKKQGDKDVFPSRAQAWVINKKGQIYCRAMPQLALTLIEKWKIDTTFMDGKTQAQGYAIGLERRATGNSFQQWSFSADGYIHSVAEPNLVLTYIQLKSDDSGDMTMEQMMSDAFGGGAESNGDAMMNDGEGEMAGSPEDVLKMKIMKQIEGDNFSGQKLLVAAVAKLPPRHSWAKAQRWALKQERLDNLGQWKHTKAQNPQWNKLAYSWPVLEDGTWNADYDWPMEGYFIPYVPPIKKLSKTAMDKTQEELRSFRNHPLRLRVMKNGERDMQKCVQVIPPDMTNMIRDLHRAASNGKHPHHKRTKSKEVDLADSMDFSMVDESQRDKFRAKEENIKELEFKLFMDRCTAALNLPFAARRIFSHEGTEYTSLDEIERDQLVFVSCGEAFADPNLSSQEQQRRMLLATLAGDIDAMRQYVFLRDPGDIVMEVEGSLGVGSRLVVNTCAMTAEERANSTRNQLSPDAEENEMEQEEDPYASMSSHQKSHARAEQEGLKWPWEKVLNAGVEEVSEVNQEARRESQEGYTNLELYRKFKPKHRKSPRSNRLSHQRFMLMDGFLIVKSTPFLVLGIENAVAECSAVVICKKNVEDASQRWEVDEEKGLIHSKANPDLVLGVSMPTYRPGDESITTSYAGQPVTLQKQRSGNGSANQVWLIEKEGEGFIQAFGPTENPEKNREITAANHASVCTYAVCGEQPTQQPGFLLTGIKSSDKVIVCPSCARAMRATHRMQKLEREVPFVCAVGTASQKGLKLIGCFQCLNGKVDLSFYEAVNTLSHYEKELKRLRQMSNARIIAREISAYQPVQSIRVKAYRNGDGRSMEGIIVIGSTIRGMLDQCTYQLQLPTAARRIYTQDGTLMLTIGDLVKWAITNYGLDNLTLGQDQKQDGASKQHSRTNSAEVRLSQPSILSMPIEVWISCGEQFVSPGYVDYRRALHNQQREERAKVALELEKEKHVLRQMQGRRTAGLEGPIYKPTLSPDAPVLVEGGWTQPGMGEVRKSLQVHQLEHHLQEVKAHQRPKKATQAVVDSNKKLYSQPNMKRVLVFKSGDKPENAIYAWGSSLSEVLHDSSLRLHLLKPALYLFSSKGEKVDSFDDLQRDQVVCASHGTGHKGPKGSRSQVEIKANWSRVRKKDGPLATNIMVSSNKHPAVEVDPFGPPALALPAPGSES